MAVEQIHQGGHLLQVHLQLQPQQLALHPVVAQHHHHNAASLIHRQQIKAAGRYLLLARGGHIGGIVHEGADRPARLGDHPVQLLHLQLEGLVDLLRLGNGKPLALHQLVDVQPVPLGGRYPSGGGVGLLQIAQLHQIRQLIADGGRADLAAHFVGDAPGAYRLGGLDIVFHHNFQYLLFSVRQFHKSHL